MASTEICGEMGEERREGANLLPVVCAHWQQNNGAFSGEGEKNCQLRRDYWRKLAAKP